MKHDETNVQQTDRDRSVWSIQTWKAGRVKLDDSDSKQRAKFQCSDFFFASCLLAHDFDQDACFINFGSLTSYQQTSSQWRLQQNYHHNSGYSWLKVIGFFCHITFGQKITSYFFQRSSEPTNKKANHHTILLFHTFHGIALDAGAAAHFQHAGGRLRQQARIQNVKRGVDPVQGGRVSLVMAGWSWDLHS